MAADPTFLEAPDLDPATRPQRAEPSPVEALLDRPVDQRLREHRYRFGQAVVFGLPVLALHLFGRSLGGAEAERWVGILQAILAGWVTYVAATGMLVEGALLLWRRGTVSGDLIVAVLAVAMYSVSLVRVGFEIAGKGSAVSDWPTLFHWVVVLLALWSATQWIRLARRQRRSTR